MTSAERLKTVLAGGIPDRVPVSCYELVGYDSHNFCNREPSYRALMDYIRERTDCLCMWEPASNEKLALSAHDPKIESVREELADGYAVRSYLAAGNRTLTRRYRIISGVYTTWTTEAWCKDTRDVDAILSLPYVPVKFDASDHARVTAELSDRGLLMPSLGDAAYQAMSLMEFGESMVWVMTETEHFAQVVKEFHRRNMINLRNELDSCPADLYRICGPEYMCPPYLPPKYFEKFMLPCLSDMVSLIHSYGRLARVHCHGRVGRVLDMILETGCDALDPCEEAPDGDTTLEELKARAGDRITLFGSMQLKLLEKGTPQEVRRETLRMMKAGKLGGRFVLMPTASPINVPLSSDTERNYRVFIDTALECAAYS